MIGMLPHMENEGDDLSELFYRRMEDGTWKEELK